MINKRISNKFSDDKLSDTDEKYTSFLHEYEQLRMHIILTAVDREGIPVLCCRRHFLTLDLRF